MNNIPNPRPEQPSSKHTAGNAVVTQQEMELLKLKVGEIAAIPTPHSVADGIHTVDQLIQETKKSFFAGLEDFCKIPEAYKNCLLDFDFRELPKDPSLGQLREFIGDS